MRRGAFDCCHHISSLVDLWVIFKILVHRKPGVSLNAILQSHSACFFSSNTSHWNLRLAGSVRQSGQQVPKGCLAPPPQLWDTATSPGVLLVGCWGWNLYSRLFPDWTISPRPLKKMLIKFYISLCQVCKRSLYILHNSPLSDLSFANRFFQSESCLLVLLVALFGEVFNLKQFHLIIRFFQRLYLKSPHQSPDPLAVSLGVIL